MVSGKYTIWLKGSLVKSIEELEQWNGRFSPSWYLTARALKEYLRNYVSDASVLDSGAAKTLEGLRRILLLKREDRSHSSIFVSSVNLKDERHIDGSSATEAIEATGGRLEPNQAVIVNTIDGVEPGHSIALELKDIRDLARKLSTVDPLTFGLLQYRGVTKKENEDGTLLQCRFLFRIPAGLSQPSSLRTLLCSSSTPPLNERVQLAKLLARSIMFVHTFNLVHKNIRQENTLVFKSNFLELGRPFLIGFEEFRSLDGPTIAERNTSWETSLYRHPSRQGLKVFHRYAMQHDIYSLGVCLLEIGLWNSFVVSLPYNDASRTTVYEPSENLPISQILQTRNQTRKARQIKDVLYQLAKEQLPAKVGKKYTDVELTCLMAWEDKDGSLGSKDEFRDEDGILIGVRYSEKIIFQLEEISV